MIDSPGGNKYPVDGVIFITAKSGYTPAIHSM